MLGEFALIKEFFSGHDKGRGITLGIGDDCALLAPDRNSELAITTDTLNEGIHFFKGEDPFYLGYKSLLVNISDLASMGARPAFFTLSLTLPDSDEHFLREFSRGLFSLADKEKMALIGGNTSKGPLSITISAYGYVAKGCAMRRDLAKPGDIIYVSGNLGMGGLFVKAGYHELDLASDLFSIVHKKAQLIPSRTVFARALRRVCRCALDVSDGTVGDLRHILERSNVGAVLNLDKLPLDEIFDQVNLTALEKVELAAFGGCDYELLFTVNPKKISLLEKIAACHRVKITPIGVITKDKNLNLLFENKPYVKANRPFEHF
ncbi:thiamine-phosphate kinase [Succinatimonas hippei]|uniref:thiamine-phosphate kinase n=1 Tax=Succinatimonas hippei TaxID=626938 RepID=UPI00255D07D2|nr:thiamine-phosphate kinase [Succinatimonas hippei]